MSVSLWNETLIHRYDLTGPRYTSYPTALEFSERFGAADLQQAAAASRQQARPLSLYFHIPFCARLCYYCACNKVVTKRREKAIPYLQRLTQEIRQQSVLHGHDRTVEQLHWGGGTPTFLDTDQMRELMTCTRQHFTLRTDDQGDYSIEIDPREASAETIAVLREIGFNRLSLGVQDFDLSVQKAVNRVQSPQQTLDILKAGRREGFRSINLDLIYGLPLQTAQSFAATLDQVLEMEPERLSIFNYAHMPQRFFPQTRIRAEDLPSPATKLLILEQTIERLLHEGYEYIGMDHFAKPTDELAVAQRSGHLHRNFQGYTTHGDCDLIGMGVSAISQVANSYYQNHHELAAYEAAIEKGELAVTRGLWLTPEDELRRAVIQQLICHFHLNFSDIEGRFQIEFTQHFAPELEELQKMQLDGLLRLDHHGIQVNDPGRLLIRAVCRVFDQHSIQKTQQGKFSKII